MTPLPAPLAYQAPEAQGEALDELVHADFERVYALFQAFVEDHEIAIGNALKTFRDAERDGPLRRDTLYAAAVLRIRGEGHRRDPVEGLPFRDTLCWLLKELANLPYRTIGEIMGLAREEVREVIADVRLALLCRSCS